MLYRETGRFAGLDEDLTGEFIRAYRFKFKKDGIAVLYADGPSSGRLMYILRLVSVKGFEGYSGEHLCAADCYRSIYHFSDDDHLIIEHDVTGPRKSYRLVTTYRRQGAA